MSAGKRRHAPGELTAKALQFLREAGKQTRAEVCEELNIGKSHGSMLMNRLHNNGEAHIAGWVHELGDGGRRYPRPQYAVGPGTDKPKPKASRKANRQRYRKRRKMRVTSVFDLGLAIRARPGCRTI